jgi:hypothetical protein
MKGRVQEIKAYVGENKNNKSEVEANARSNIETFDTSSSNNHKSQPFACAHASLDGHTPLAIRYSHGRGAFQIQ